MEQASKNRRTPSELDFPVYLMNFPFTVSNDQPNNPWMEINQEYDYDKAYAQFMKLYMYVTDYALIYVLPSEKCYQDLPYVANIGCYLPHLDNTILIANFKSNPRKGEELIGRKFFQSMGYTIDKPPFTFEGEADLKWLRDNIYIAGYGIRTDIRSHNWMKNKYDMEIVSVKMTDKKLYHFDCSLFPLGSHKVLVATKVMSRRDVKAIEKVVEIVDVPNEFIYSGWTNCISIGNKILHAPASRDENGGKTFSKFMEKTGMEPVIFDLSEFEKSGADMSCLFMHLNYMNRKQHVAKANYAWLGERMLRIPKAKIKRIPPPSHQITFNGFKIVIENPVGDKRYWTDPATGEKGSTTMLNPYGYFMHSKGMDKDALDCYVGPNEKAEFIYAVRQMVPHTGKQDEVKVMIGFTTPLEAKVAYLNHYNNPAFYGGMTTWPVEEFRAVLRDTLKDPSIIKSAMDQVLDIEQLTKANTNFRKVIFTNSKCQLVIMDLKSKEDVGEETHKYVEQVVFVLEGVGRAVLGDSSKEIEEGSVFVISPGMKHNIINIGNSSLKLYTIYTPPNHLNGRVHKTKQDAMNDEEDEKFGHRLK